MSHCFTRMELLTHALFAMLALLIFFNEKGPWISALFPLSIILLVISLDDGLAPNRRQIII